MNKRREFLGHGMGMLGLLAGASGSAHANLQSAEIVVIGGGYGGATAAKYLRLFSNNTARVTLIEPNAAFISCPLSNLVVGGSKNLTELTISYAHLSKRHGIKMIQDSALQIDPETKRIKLFSGQIVPYDK